MAIRKRYVRYPELLVSDIESQRHYHELLAKWRTQHFKERIRTRMIGKRELLARGITDQAKIGEYLSLPENQHRRVSAKTAYKACRK